MRYLRRMSYSLINNRAFILYFTFLECLNMILLSLEGSINDDVWMKLNSFVWSFFIIEFLIKIHSFTIKRNFFIEIYFKNLKFKIGFHYLKIYNIFIIGKLQFSIHRWFFSEISFVFAFII